MNKINKAVAILCAATCLSATVFAACGGQNDKFNDTDFEDLPAYTGTNYEGKDPEKVQFSTDLFYRNDKKAKGADPYVYDNVKTDGYYYMFVTEGLCNCYRSKDLVNWEEVGPTLNTWQLGKEEEIQVTWNAVWAEEIIYDEDEGKYHMFFSVSPNDRDAAYILISATSDKPYGPYELVNYEKAETCGGSANMRDNTTEKYNDFYTKYCLLEPAKYEAFSKILDVSGTSSNGYYAAIDPHPYVAEDGTKYLYFVNSLNCNSICVIQMENWYTPLWHTAKSLTVAHYYTVQDYIDERNGIPVDYVTYEMGSAYINEGPAITYRNGMYYLTFSINGFGDSTYQVIQAVSENPDGPFRKLTEEEGGQLLCVQNIDSNEKLSGTGHHSFIERDGKDYIIYHRHDNYIKGGSARNPAVDEIRWMTVDDINGNPLDVMYVNGPTWSVQPLPYTEGGYNNVATQATVTLTQGALAEGSSVRYLNDDILSVQAETEFAEKYIHETVITKTSMFEFKFSKPMDVRAVMVYNSANYKNIFMNIKKIELDCVINGTAITKEIRDIAFPEEYYSRSNYDQSLRSVSAGAAAFAEFDNITVTAVRVVVDVPEGQEQVGLSEIRILGKDGTSTSSVKTDYAPRFAVDMGDRVSPGDITIDGKLDEQIWEDMKSAGGTVTQDIIANGINYGTVTAYSHFDENGITLAFDVSVDYQTIYHNPNRGSFMNTSVELYLYHEKATDALIDGYQNHGYEMDLQLDGTVVCKRRVTGGGDRWWQSYNAPYEIQPYCVAGVYHKDENGNITPSKYNEEGSNGFVVEYFIPFGYFEYTGFIAKGEKLESVRIDPALILTFNYAGENLNSDRVWVSTTGSNTWATVNNWICDKDGVRRP